MDGVPPDRLISIWEEVLSPILEVILELLWDLIF
jgi:hypothetical protein